MKNKVKKGQTVSVHYVGTFEDGTEFDNSRKREQALTFQVGSGQMISGFDKAVSTMKVGETKEIKLTPDAAYGTSREDLIREVPQTSFPEDFEFKVKGVVQGENSDGQPFLATIEAVNESNVVLNFNHPMAGKNLNFEIELLSVGQESKDAKGN